MHEYILISTLNDFVFCPYSIYLHNVYSGGEDELVHDVPQTLGKAAHNSLDNNTYSTRKSDIAGLSVFSYELGLIGKIDLYHADRCRLIERKYQLKTIYQGQIYQLWAQCFCMREMGYTVNSNAFYSISTNTVFEMKLPGDAEKEELKSFINLYLSYNPMDDIEVIPAKCCHCIYCNLCDKAIIENVYNQGY